MSVKNISFYQSLDDAVLIEYLQAGNKHAFREIYFRYHEMLYLLAIRYLKDKDMAQDAVQEIFVRLWNMHQNVIVSVNLKNYLYTMVKNHILNVIRDQNTAIKHNYEMAQVVDVEDDSLLTKIKNKELMDILYRAIDALPEQKRKICTLKIQENLSNQEIADRMGLSINTVKSHYTQTLKMLKGYMEKMIIIVWVLILS